MTQRGISKRHIRRLISQKKNEFVNNLIDVEKQTLVINSENNCNIATSSTSSFKSVKINVKKPLREKLKEWIIRNRPSRKSVEELMVILKEEQLDVPLSLKTLFPNREKALIKQVFPISVLGNN